MNGGNHFGFLPCPVMRTNHRANPLFLNYLVNAADFSRSPDKLAIRTSATIESQLDEILSMLFRDPQSRNSVRSVAYLDAKTAEISRIVAGIESQIATLTAYRKSLIHECVTGQRRITESDVQRAAAQRKFDNLALTG